MFGIHANCLTNYLKSKMKKKSYMYVQKYFFIWPIPEHLLIFVSPFLIQIKRQT